MVEVLFGESEAGAMKIAKRQLERDRWRAGVEQQVICLGFMLDIRDIK